MNTLYYGDNLDILRRYVKDETVDLVYLDPPFKSDQNYNVLFAEQDGTRAAAQIMAFEDTWEWNEDSARAFEETVTAGGKVSDVMRAFETFLGHNTMLAYLSMIAPRLVELRRVLKSTGSIYLHCDPTASHYLKLLMDAVFGHVNFRNEITWKRTSAHNDPGRYGANADMILFYVKGDKWTWNQVFVAHGEEYQARFRHSDPDGRRWSDYDLTAKGLSGGGYEYEYKGVTSLWRCPLSTMKRYDKEGKLHFTRAGGIRLKRYLDELKGVVLQTVWDDISPINSQAAERLGYPTQKPEALLERIIQASSNEGDVVLDPFWGCGTAVAVAQKLKRKWIGIDITHLAMTLIKKRLFDSFGISTAVTPPQAGGNDISLRSRGDKRGAESYKVIGEPVDLSGAKKLAEDDKYQFQWWALSLVHARPVEQKKGADQGIDGRRYFIEGKDRHSEQIIFSVKGGHVTSSQVRDLRGVIEREKAAFGIFITLEPATKEMRKEATSAGFYESELQGTKHPRLQIFTIEELLDGKPLDIPAIALMPYMDTTFKKAPKAKSAKTKNEKLDI